MVALARMTLCHGHILTVHECTSFNTMEPMQSQNHAYGTKWLLRACIVERCRGLAQGIQRSAHTACECLGGDDNRIQGGRKARQHMVVNIHKAHYHLHAATVW